MPVGKGKTRITITIHNETKDMLEELLSLHDNSTYSNIIEIALYCYAHMVADKLDEEKGDPEENAKS